MLYRIVGANGEWHLASHTLDPVIKVARRKLHGLPAGSQVTIFRGSERVGAIRNESLFEPDDPYSDPKNW